MNQQPQDAFDRFFDRIPEPIKVILGLAIFVAPGYYLFVIGPKWTKRQEAYDAACVAISKRLAAPDSITFTKFHKNYVTEDGDDHIVTLTLTSKNDTDQTTWGKSRLRMTETESGWQSKIIEPTVQVADASDASNTETDNSSEELIDKDNVFHKRSIAAAVFVFLAVVCGVGGFFLITPEDSPAKPLGWVLILLAACFGLLAS